MLSSQLRTSRNPRLGQLRSHTARTIMPRSRDEGCNELDQPQSTPLFLGLPICEQTDKDWPTLADLPEAPQYAPRRSYARVVVASGASIQTLSQISDTPNCRQCPSGVRPPRQAAPVSPLAPGPRGWPSAVRRHGPGAEPGPRGHLAPKAPENFSACGGPTSLRSKPPLQARG